MAIIAVEKNGSRRFISDPGNSSIEFLYTVTGTSSETAVNTYMLLHHVNPYPVSGFFSFTYRSMDIEPVWVDATNDEGMWDVTVYYGAQEALIPEETLTFNTGGGMQHITQSMRTQKAYGAPGIVVSRDDNRGAINVNGDSVDGVDIIVPIYNFTITKRFDADIANGVYRRTLAAMTGTVNNARFREFEAGEVLFMGANGSIFRDEKQLVNGYAKEYWDITFDFAASPNRDDLSIGKGENGEPLIDGIKKLGWEYMWVKYQDDVSRGWLTKVPMAVYIEQIYRYTDFSELKLS